MSSAAGLSRCERQEIVTSHAAFGYLAERYGLEQVAITGIAPEAEPTPRDSRASCDKVQRDGATTVFFETLVSPELAETVAHEVGAKTAMLDPLEGLTERGDKGGRGLLLGDAREPRRAAKGAGMPVAVELRDVSFAYDGGSPSSSTSTSPSKRASSWRSQGRTAAARRR